MTFTTPVFLIFLSIVFPLTWTLRGRARVIFLLAASLVFYGWWDWRFLPLMVGTALLDYAVALALERSERRPVRRALMVVSLASNLGLLAFFKYSGFLAQVVDDVAMAASGQPLGLAMSVILPIGISFYTFQALSYTIDVYRKQLRAVQDPIQYMAFITFFPQLVAGPIERAANLLGQFSQDREFDPRAAEDGCRQMLWGFFKKMVVADNLSPIVDSIYSSPQGHTDAQLLFATYCFAFQIYADFSGYTDIATGCAKCFGFRLMRNFATPYFATDIVDFWRRWHISLSTWFRDYVYIPLGGSRVGTARQYVNVFVVFLLSGFWHGANWTFVAWGVFHGAAYLVTSHYLVATEKRNVLPAPVRMLLTFNVVCVGWVYFRAPDISTAHDVLRRIVTGGLSGLAGVAAAFPFAVSVMAILLIVEWLDREREHGFASLDRLPTWARWASYYGVTASILLLAYLDFVPFIYFQF